SQSYTSNPSSCSATFQLSYKWERVPLLLLPAANPKFSGAPELEKSGWRLESGFSCDQDAWLEVSFGQTLRYGCGTIGIRQAAERPVGGIESSVEEMPGIHVRITCQVGEHAPRFEHLGAKSPDVDMVVGGFFSSSSAKERGRCQQSMAKAAISVPAVGTSAGVLSAPTECHDTCCPCQKLRQPYSARSYVIWKD
ncbi:hypothetical protein LCGC14_2073060, partial [marine sediment metagenome]